MAHWEGEKDKSSLILEQEEFDRLPTAIKEDNGGHCVFYQQDAWLAMVGLPQLLLQYPVSKIADWDHEQAVRISYAHGALLDRIRTERALLYQRVMEEWYPWKPYPQAGDVVLLTDEWPWAGSLCKVGTYGVIGGCIGEQYDDLSVTWNYSAHRGWSSCGARMIDLRSKHFLTNMDKEWREYVSCSGGPATIALPTKVLRPTDDRRWTRYWCWLSLPKAHTAVYFNMEVPVWTWDGKGYGS